MEISQQFKLLEQQIKDNIINWYPMEENIQYIILEDFCKEKFSELKEAVNNLQENGKILIFMDNSLAIKNICINNANEKQLYNKKEIEKILDDNGLIYRKFYYSLPDCRLVNVIFTDKHLPDQETILRNITFYDKETIEVNKENEIFRKILAQEPSLFKIFANAFFIECSKSEFKDNQIEFVSFSNMRKEEYRIKTVIKGDSVYKKAVNQTSENHIKNIEKNIDILNQCNINILDRYENSTIISEYQKNGKTLEKIIIEKLQKDNIGEVKKLIKDLYRELKEKLITTDIEENVFKKYKIEYKKEDIENLTFVKYGFWDMIFQNIFYIDNKYFFYDQEWLEEKLPIEFIIYRTIIYSPQLNEMLNVEEIFKEFNIKTENLKIFQMLDNKLQDKIRSENCWEIHIGNNNLNKILYDLKQKDEKIQQLENDKEEISQNCKKLLNEKDARIKFLEENMEQTVKLLHKKENMIELMKNSTSWKITEPLRKLRSNKKEKKK